MPVTDTLDDSRASLQARMQEHFDHMIDSAQRAMSRTGQVAMRDRLW